MEHDAESADALIRANDALLRELNAARDCTVGLALTCASFAAFIDALDPEGIPPTIYALLRVYADAARAAVAAARKDAA